MIFFEHVLHFAEVREVPKTSHQNHRAKNEEFDRTFSLLYEHVAKFADLFEDF